MCDKKPLPGAGSLRLGGSSPADHGTVWFSQIRAISTAVRFWQLQLLQLLQLVAEFACCKLAVRKACRHDALRVLTASW
jgi:hypothetical protein